MLVADFGSRPHFSAAFSFTAGEVVGKICHTDLRPGPRDADGAHEHVHAGFLLCEDVLDEGADF